MVSEKGLWSEHVSKVHEQCLDHMVFSGQLHVQPGFVINLIATLLDMTYLFLEIDCTITADTR